MGTFNHGPSEQVVCTPPGLIRAVQSKLEVVFSWDAAATKENSVTGSDACFTEQTNALEQDWSGRGTIWCNPPYKLGGKFAAKACREWYRNGADSALLVLASVGSIWWADSVDRYAHVLFLRPRVTFVGHDQPFMKDLAIVYYGRLPVGYECWNWHG